MSSFLLISAISRGLWFIEPSLVGGYAPAIQRLLSREGNREANDASRDRREGKEQPVNMDLLDWENLWRGKEYQYFAIHPETGAKHLLFDEAPEGSVAVIPIEGVMLRHDYCGIMGYETMELVLAKAQRHSNICAVVMKFHTPGGAVDYLKEFARALQSCSKFVMSFSSGLNCSAGIYAAAYTDYHIAENDLVQLGSIGTMMTLTDYSKMYKLSGIEFHEIYADGSEEKNTDSKEALKGNYGPIKAKILNPHREDFVETVKSGRGDKIKDDGHLFKGDTFLASACLPESGNGLIDEIGSFAYAVQFAAEQGRTGQDFSITQASNHSNTIMFGNKTPKLVALQGKAEKDISDADIDAVNAELTALGITGVKVYPSNFQAEAEKLQLENSTVGQLTADLKTANDAQAKAVQELATEKTAHQETKTELDNLKENTTADEKNKGGDKGGDKIGEVEDLEDFTTPVDAELERINKNRA
ncbi:MAG: S49 family peptidase [Bacteroidia bacterium]